MSPRLLVELVHRCFGLQIPDRVKLLRGPEVVRVLGTERIADGVLVARRYGRTRESIVVEVQLRVVRSKRKAWALYVVGTWAELGAPTTWWSSRRRSAWHVGPPKRSTSAMGWE